MDKGQVKADFKLKANMFMIEDPGRVGIWKYEKAGDLDFDWMILPTFVNAAKIQIKTWNKVISNKLWDISISIKRWSPHLRNMDF